MNTEIFTDYIQVNPKVVLEKDKEYPFIEMSNVGIFQREPEKVEVKKYGSGTKFQRGDTVVARIEPCLQNGKGFFVKDFDEGFGSTEFLVFRSKDGEKLDNIYLYYLMQNQYIRECMIRSMSGATGRQRVNNKVFESIQVNIPSLDKQKKIAHILKAYDDLIENNLKRIELLEEAAESIYKEWFVNFRFPGYEKYQIVDDIPIGWSKKEIGDMCVTVGGGTPSTKNIEYWDNGDIIWITPTDVTNNKSLILLDSQRKITKLGLEKSSARIVPADTILMTSRATIGYFALIDSEVCTNQGFINVIPNKECYRMYMLFNLIFRKDEIIGISGGATYKEISKGRFSKLGIIVPDEKILIKFNDLAYSFLKQVRALKKQIKITSEARDILISKLIMGEIEV